MSFLLSDWKKCHGIHSQGKHCIYIYIYEHIQPYLKLSTLILEFEKGKNRMLTDTDGWCRPCHGWRVALVRCNEDSVAIFEIPMKLTSTTDTSPFLQGKTCWPGPSLFTFEDIPRGVLKEAHTAHRGRHGKFHSNKALGDVGADASGHKIGCVPVASISCWGKQVNSHVVIWHSRGNPALILDVTHWWFLANYLWFVPGFAMNVPLIMLQKYDPTKKKCSLLVLSSFQDDVNPNHVFK